MPRRTVPDKVVCDEAFSIAKNSNFDGYQRGIVSMVYELFDKNSSGGAVKNYIMPNQPPSDLRQYATINKKKIWKTNSILIF